MPISNDYDLYYCNYYPNDCNDIPEETYYTASPGHALEIVGTIHQIVLVSVFLLQVPVIRQSISRLCQLKFR